MLSKHWQGYPTAPDLWHEAKMSEAGYNGMRRSPIRTTSDKTKRGNMVVTIKSAAIKSKIRFKKRGPGRAKLSRTLNMNTS